MSKINQIENRLREMDGGAFQKLCDAYLHKKGYEQINSLGSVVGSNKVRRGTPDTFVPLPNGKYVFAEYTTQQEGLYDKLGGDLNKCLDESKSGIPSGSIEKIVFCHTGQLTGEEHNSLVNACQAAGVKLDVVGLSVIAYDLYQKYPGLARDFLGVEVDTGQILSQDDFIRTYEANKLATPLSTTFRFREEKIALAIGTLEAGRLVIITGRPGVGKSRFALECCSRFVAVHSDYTICCILNRGPDLFEDIRVHFSSPGKYVILVDDANRISRFEYIVQLLQSGAEQVDVKVVATVRDYAAAKITEKSLPCGGATELELKPFEDKEIRQLISEEYGITNEHYLERIAHVARGNARLAVMAALIACRENRPESIADVTALYDEYYASIRRDIEGQGLGDPSLLKVAGLIAFFRHVDKTNTELMREVTAAFGVSNDDFWKAAIRLHEIEMLDMYENEVVRVSDQVLGTYLFYLAFFRDRVLDFGALLAAFFPSLKGKLRDAIHPILSAFDNRAIVGIMRPHVERRWATFERNGDTDGLLQLMHSFWFVKETDTLARVKEWIDEMEPEECPLSQVHFTPAGTHGGPSILSLLEVFRWSSNSNLRIAVGLMVDYARRRPAIVPEVLHTIIETYGFRHDDAMYGWQVQQAVVDVLWDRTQTGEELLARIFLKIAEEYLKTYFSPIVSSTSKSFTMTKFIVPATDEVKTIRRCLWEGIFSLYKCPVLREEVIALIEKQRYSSYRASHELVADDAPRVLSFIDSTLDPGMYFHNVAVQEYLTFLQECNVSFDPRLRDSFQNETWRIGELLMEEYHPRDGVALGYDEFWEMKRQRLSKSFAGYTYSDYNRLIQRCQEIRKVAERRHRDGVLKISLAVVINAIADRDFTLYARVLEHYLRAHDPLALEPSILVRSLLKHGGPDMTYELLVKHGYANTGWMGELFQCLEAEHITPDYVQRVLRFYEDADPQAIPWRVGFLLRYRSVDAEIFPGVTKIILERSARESRCVYGLSMLFNPYGEVNKRLIEVFAGDLGLLKQAYIAVSATKGHDDFDGESFSRILDVSPEFLEEYIDARYRASKHPSSYDDTRDYRFLWRRDDYKTLGTRLVEHMYDCERRRGAYHHGYLRAFIKGDDSAKTEPLVADRQDEVLRDLIIRRNDEIEFMRFLFGLVAELGPDRARPLIAHFLGVNKSFEVFKQLRLEPDHACWSGSAVPTYQKGVDYFESLLPLVDSAELLKHKQLLEGHIEWLRAMIEREKRRDFMDED